MSNLSPPPDGFPFISFPRTTFEAFDTAIERGDLSSDSDHPRYAANYMYMWAETNGKGLVIDVFKHGTTRKYLRVNVT